MILKRFVNTAIAAKNKSSITSAPGNVIVKDDDDVRTRVVVARPVPTLRHFPEDGGVRQGRPPDPADHLYRRSDVVMKFDDRVRVPIEQVNN